MHESARGSDPGGHQRRPEGSHRSSLDGIALLSEAGQVLLDERSNELDVEHNAVPHDDRVSLEFGNRPSEHPRSHTTYLPLHIKDGSPAHAREAWAIHNVTIVFSTMN